MKWKALKDFLFNLVSDGANPSSKRVAGVLGWVVCLAASIIGIFYPIQSPDVIEMLFWSSCALLGLDSIMGAFGKRRNPFNTDNKKGDQQ